MRARAKLPETEGVLASIGGQVDLQVRHINTINNKPVLAQHAKEAGYALQFFALEFFFRGFVLRGMAAEFGSMAMMVMMIPYCMIHFGKPLPECLGSIVAGMVLGTLAMDTRSIWGGITIHVAVAWSMDAAALWHKS